LGRQWNARRFALHVAVIVVGRDFMVPRWVGGRARNRRFTWPLKFPLIILLTTAGNALLNAMLAPLLGLNIPFRQSCSAIFDEFHYQRGDSWAFSR